jgi:hypothetical protein
VVLAGVLQVEVEHAQRSVVRDLADRRARPAGGLEQGDELVVVQGRSAASALASL